MRLKCSKINTSFEYNAPVEFVQSQWQTGEKSLVYLVYRWIIACFFIFSVVVSITHNALVRELHVYFIYLTHWNLMFTMVTMIWGASLTSLHHMNRLEIKEKMTRRLKIYWFLSTSSNMYSVIVSIIYWTVLFKTDLNKVDLNNVLIHVTNSLVLLINLAVVKQPERFGLFIYPLSCGCMFLFFTWLYPFLGGKNRRGQDFIYTILNWNERPGRAALAAIGVTVAGAIIHALIYGLHRLRQKINEKYLRSKEEKAKANFIVLTL